MGVEKYNMNATVRVDRIYGMIKARDIALENHSVGGI